MRFRSKESSLASCLLAISLFSLSARGQRELPGWVNAQLPWQKAVVDDNERLLAWYHPEKNQGFDKVMRLAWDFIEHKVPNDTRTGTGLKIYLINSVFDDRTLQGSNYQHNPASVYGQFVDSLLVWYPYSGDSEAIEVVRSMLDYQLAHGTTPADWNWSHVPYATSCDDDREYGRCIRGMLNDFLGGIEVDKLGELGIGYVFFYELSGDRKYLDAGLRCADALARHIRPGDAEHTPWPFRVNAKSGEVINGEEYGGMIVAPVRLFDELIRLKAGDTESYQRALDTAWRWIFAYPMDSRSKGWDKWSGYFEDVPEKHLERQPGLADHDGLLHSYSSGPCNGGPQLAQPHRSPARLGASQTGTRALFRRLGDRRAGHAGWPRLLFARGPGQRHLPLGGNQCPLLREDRRHASARERLSFTQLCKLFRRFGWENLLLRGRIRWAVLV